MRTALFPILAALLPAAGPSTIYVTWERTPIEHPPWNYADWCVVVQVGDDAEPSSMRLCPAVFPVKPLGIFLDCMLGPGVTPPDRCAMFFDGDRDGDVDLRDWALIMR